MMFHCPFEGRFGRFRSKKVNYNDILSFSIAEKSHNDLFAGEN